MALRQLLIARRLAELEAERATLRQKVTEAETRRSLWREREERAEAALSEMTEETPEADRAAFDAECTEIEAENAAITAEEEANAARNGEIDREVASLAAELEELKQRAARSAAQPKQNNTEKRGRETNMNTMNMDRRERIRAAIAEGDGKTFVQNIRTAIQQRGITGAALTVPTHMLPMVREAIAAYSVLLKHVNVMPLKGDGKMNILGAVPEAVWTESTGKINELEFALNQVTVDGNKVAGFIPVPNAYLEDSDEDLAGIVMDTIGKSIGLAVDKAILYGNGNNMPVGIMTRLAASTSPAWWQTNMPAFTNLATTNVGKLSASTVTGTKLYAEMVKVLGRAKKKYDLAGASKFWAMSETTWMQLQTELMTFNSAGAIVTGAQRIMPIVGGTVELLDFIPDGTVVGGYGQNYIMAERRKMEIAQSEHAMFIEDNTVFRAKARYDGIPVAGEAFAAFSLTTTAPTASMTFAEDTANAPASDSE